MRRKHVLAAVLVAGFIAAVLESAFGDGVTVGLQNGTATFTQSCTFHSPDLSVDGILSNNGWAIATTCLVPFDATENQTAVWETGADVDADELHLRLHQNFGFGQHLIGRFRFSVTSDNRSTFADDLDNGGDVEANWTVLMNPSVSGPTGMTFTTLADGSVLAGGPVPDIGTYDVHYSGNFVGITGIRLEVLEHPSLPFDGPGLQPLNGNFVLTELEVFALAAEVQRITIDIKPGSDPNAINPRSKGVIPVAILTTDTFDATTVDATTVLFGPHGVETAPVRFALEYVDGDFLLDMILHFKTQDTTIACGDRSATLTGETFGGEAIEGSDFIRTVGCK